MSRTRRPKQVCRPRRRPRTLTSSIAKPRVLNFQAVLKLGQALVLIFMGGGAGLGCPTSALEDVLSQLAHVGSDQVKL